MRTASRVGAIVLSGFLAGLAAGCARPAGPDEYAEPAVGPPASVPSTCRLEVKGPVAPLDLAVAIDASLSTRQPSGTDIDGDGVVGVLRDGGSTDAGDSLLAAEVAGVRSLLRNAEPLDAWIAVVTFSGSNTLEWKSTQRLVTTGNAKVRSPLSDDVAALESVLDGVLRRGARGTTDFTAGVGTASQVLLVAPKVSPSARRAVFLVSDSPSPIVIGPTATLTRTDLKLTRVAAEAANAGVVVYTFGIGEAAETETPHALSLIASTTGGRYWAVDDPRELHCHLLRALDVATLE